MNAKLRAAVKDRAECRCEACGRWLGDGGEIDHFWGRAKVKESVENCWLLCGADTLDWRPCHRQKTDNHPSAAYWVLVFQGHCNIYHYEAEQHRCEVRLEVLTQKGALNERR